jgi:hypothetical protein
VYSAVIENKDTQAQNNESFVPVKIIRNRHWTFDRVLQSIIRRVQACIDSGAGNFEHLL